MKYQIYLVCILIFSSFAAHVAASDFLSLNNSEANAAAKQDIKDTMGKETLFNSTVDVKGKATPVITGTNIAGATVNTGSPQPKDRLFSPMNSWRLDLQDTQDRSVTLEMSQSNDVVFGKGTIVTDSSVQNATATGTISQNKLHLDILTADLTLFRLDLTMNRKSFSGDYHGYSPSYVSWKGIAMGSIS
jgi:hypothetical protein